MTGKVKNVVDFGAFVDIGIKESALIHVSEVADRYVRDPMEVLKVGDVKEFRIISLDPDRKRIGLSLRKEGGARGGERVPAEVSSDREAGPRPGPGPAGEGRRVESVRGPTGTSSRSDAPSTRQDTRSPGGSRGRNPYSQSARTPPGGPKPEDDDGTTYNPFAELLKGRSKG